MNFTMSASLGWVTKSCRDHQFWYSMVTKYPTIQDWDYNWQKHQKFHIWPFQICLTYLISAFFFNLTSHLSFSYLISGTFILFYLLVFNHLVLNLNKSHNTLKENWEVKTKLLYFDQLVGLKKLCATVCIAVFTRLILTCQKYVFGHSITSWL